MSKLNIFCWLVAALFLGGCAKDGSTADSAPPPYRGRPLKVADFPNVKNSVYGAWTADTADFGDGLYYVLNIYLNDRGDVGLSRTCGGHGDVIDAAMVLNGSVTPTQIEIEESAQVTETTKHIANCTLTVQAGSLNYKKTTNDKLQVETAPGEFKSFSRMAQP